jgi:hypothetical protein
MPLRHLRLVILAPVAAFTLLVVSMVTINAIIGALSSLPFGAGLQMPLVTALCLGGAALLSMLGGRWTWPNAHPSAVILAVTLPCFVLTVLLTGLLSSAGKIARHTPGHAIFFLGLGAALAVAARLADAGRRRAAWWGAITGAVVAADLAVISVLRQVVLPPDEGALDRAYAPLWLFTALTDSGFGLPHPDAAEIFTIGDVVALDPLLFIVFSGLAVGAVLSRRRRTAPATA